MNKGNMAAAGAMLVMAVIALSVTDTICAPFCQCVPDATATNASVPLNVWVNNTCTGDKCATDYYLVCDGDTLVVGQDYSISDCDYRVENATYNNTACTLHYTYEGPNYHGTDVLGLVMCNIPVIAAVTALALAGIWVFMK